MKEMSLNDKRSEHVRLWSRILPGEIADHLPVGVALIDELFILRNCNKHFKKYVDKYSRYRSDNALGMSFFDLFPDCQNLLSEVLRSVRDEGRQYIDFEVPVQLDLKAPVKQSYWDTTVVPVLDDQCRVAGIVIFALDATEIVITKIKLQKKEIEIDELKTALRTFTNLHEEDRQSWELNAAVNINDTIIPFVDKLRTSLTRTDQLNYLKALRKAKLARKLQTVLGFHYPVSTFTVKISGRNSV